MSCRRVSRVSHPRLPGALFPDPGRCGGRRTTVRESVRFRNRLFNWQILDLGSDLEGHLSDDSERLEGLCRRFLDLDPEVRDAYIVARRSGYYLTLDAFLSDPGALSTFAPAARELLDMGGGSLVLGMERGLRFRRI